jgi:hypothetical protein
MSETNDAPAESLVSLVEQIMAARETVSPELRAKQRRLLRILVEANVPAAPATVDATSNDGATGQSGQDTTAGAKT